MLCMLGAMVTNTYMECSTLTSYLMGIGRLTTGLQDTPCILWGDMSVAYLI